MLQLVILHLVVAAIAPALVGLLRRKLFLVLAAVPASAAAWAATQTADVLAGRPVTQEVAWVPSLGLELTFRLDPLSWLMTLVVGGVGALVLVYCAPYFARSAHRLGRFAGVFVAFAGAMLGVVTADSTLLLYVFWELTTVFSFLLIGHYHDRQASRRAAMQAIQLTTLGGLAMLAGFVILGEIDGGSYRVSELVAGAADIPRGGLLTTALVLVVVGAATKSALVPVHFWLPAAMAAPTPVSAYLHAAAMVKAGVFLVARLTPAFADVPAWRWTVVGLGVATMIVGGWRALRQYDLKLVLAFGTVSQLGLIIALLGQGERAVALAGLALLLAHALFKAALFLVVGIVDWSVGTRDLRELSGLRRRMPVVALCGALAVASMAGLPPLVGYVAKEAALEAFAHAGDAAGWGLLVVVALGSVLTLAYGLRFWWGAFADKPGVEPRETQRTSHLIVAPPLVLSAAGLVLGLVPGTLERALAPYAGSYAAGEAGHLTLWGGVGVPLMTTAVVIVVGVLLFVGRAGVARVQRRAAFGVAASDVYRATLRLLDNLAADVTGRTQRGSLPAYLAAILVVTVTAPLVVMLGSDAWPRSIRVADSPEQVIVAAVVVAAAVLVARARRRLKAVLLLGVAGYGVAVLYQLHGAPDLALTQVLVETVTLVVFVLVLRRLPAYFSNRPLAASRWWRVILGVLSGAAAVGLGLMASGARVHAPVSVNFPAEVYAFGYGRNIVNVTIVDTRAWDTIGEISVLLVAATGVASLIFLRTGAGKIHRTRDRHQQLEPAQSASVWRRRGEIDVARALRGSAADHTEHRHAWLRGTSTLAPQRRSVIFEVSARLVFHTMLVVSVFLLFAGHNAPGGGFAGGLVAGIALAVRYLAGGRYELGDAMPVQPGVLLGAGLFLSAGVGAVPLLFGGDVLQSTVVDADLGLLGELHLATALFFDIGVYLVVVGLVLDILRSLGAEIDRHGELEGKVAPDLPHDEPVRTADDTATEAAAAEEAAREAEVSR